MNKPKIKNYLHELIHSLSQTEKRYFKLIEKQQSGSKKSDYLLLFEAIEKQKDFDEEKIKEKFRGSNIEKRYASLKKYLYELILKSLAFYNHDNIATVKVRRMLDSAEVLQRKGLYHQAIRKLEKAEIAAEEAGMNFILHDIRRLSMSCKTMIGDVPDIEGFNSFKNDQLILTDRLKQTTIIYNKNIDLVYHSMYNHSAEGNIKTEEFKSIIDKDFLDLEDHLIGGYNKHLYYRTLKIYFSTLEEKKPLYKYTLAHVKVFEDDELKIKNHPSNYIHSIMDVIEFLNLNKDYEKIDRWINKAKLFFEDKKNSYFNKGNDYAHLLCLEQTHLINQNRADEYLIKAEFINDYIEEKGNQINSFAYRWLLYDNIWCYIFSNNPKKALKLSNELINDKEVKTSFYLNTESILQNMIIHYELKNFNYLDFAINSFFNELIKKYKLNEVELTVFKFFRKNLKSIGSSSMSNRTLFENLLEECDHVNTSTYDFSYLFLIKWLKIKAGLYKPNIKSVIS